MYVNNGLSGYGTSDFNKALKGTNVAAIQKGLDFQKKQLAGRKAKDVKGIAADRGQIAAAEARLAQLTAPAKTASPLPTPIAIAQVQPSPVPASAPVAPIEMKTPPQVTSAPKTPPSAPADPYPGVAPTIPSAAPPAASDAVATIAPNASNFGPPETNFGPAFGPPTVNVTVDPSQAGAPAPVAEELKMPLILLGIGALALFLLKKKG